MTLNLAVEIELDALSFLEHPFVAVGQYELQIRMQRERLDRQVLEFEVFVAGKKTVPSPALMI